MEVRRRIGRHDLLVETREPCGIWLEESAIVAGAGLTEQALQRTDVLRALCSGDDYRPLSIQWELLDKCNFACPFCYIVGHSSCPVVRYSEIHTAIAELVNHGLLFCTLTGGEVTIHPDFLSIYSHLKKNGVVVDVFTNGYSIDDDVIDAFQLYPPAVVEVSLYSVSNDRLRDRYGAKGYRAASAVLGNVLRLKRAGVNVVCKSFLNTVTRLEFEEVAIWCRRNGIGFYSSSRLTHAYDGANVSRYEVGATEVCPSLVPIQKRDVCFPCGTKNYGAAIDATFSLLPCPAIRLDDRAFDMRKIGVKEAVKGMKAFIRRFQDTEIVGPIETNRASCMAFAKPVRTESGELYSGPRKLDSRVS